jgi:hypothetical protein
MTTGPRTRSARARREPFPAATHVPGIPDDERSGAPLGALALAARGQSGAPRLTRLVAVAVAVVAVVAGVEALYRWAGGLPSIPPGLTKSELDWKLTHLPAERLAVVVGDSRVGWGFSETDFLEGQRAAGAPPLAAAANLGAPGHATEDLVRYVTRFAKPCPGCALIVSFTPAGFYTFDGGWTEGGKPKVTLQELIDDHVRSFLSEHVYTYGAEARVVARMIRGALLGRRLPNTTYVSRHEYAGGFMNATLAASDGQPIDATEFQLGQYKDLILKRLVESPERAPAREAGMLSALGEARKAGWKVFLVRFPIGPRMRALETSVVPSGLDAASFAAAAGLPLLDYDADPRTRTLATVDSSHLAPASARALSRVLGQDVAAAWPR